MTEPKKRPRRRRPKPDSPLPVEHPQRRPEGISWDTTSIRVTPPAAPCVDPPAPWHPPVPVWKAYLADSFTRTARRLLRWADSLTRTA